MTTFVSALRSSLGKKYLMALTGLIWTVFAIGHLTGNLLLLFGRRPFNEYAHFLEGLAHGTGVYFADLFLLLAIAIHVWHGIETQLVDKAAARPSHYRVAGSAGGKSRKGPASTGMIWTGLFLLFFLIVHIISFKFAWTYMTVPTYDLDGLQVKDLYEVVVIRFSNALYVLFYTVAMWLFGMHLKHGVWSAFQSLGLLNKRTYPAAVSFATFFGILMAVGFLMLPVLVFVMNDSFTSPQGGLRL